MSVQRPSANRLTSVQPTPVMLPITPRRAPYRVRIYCFTTKPKYCIWIKLIFYLKRRMSENNYFFNTLPIYRRYGAVHKVRRARGGGGGVLKGVTVCDRGEGSRAGDVTLIKIFIIHMKHEI